MRTLSITNNNMIDDIYRDINIKIIDNNTINCNDDIDITIYCIERLKNSNKFINNDELFEFGSKNTLFSMKKKNKIYKKQMEKLKNIDRTTRFSIFSLNHAIINPSELAEIKFTGNKLDLCYAPVCVSTFYLNEIELKQFKKEFKKLDEFYYSNQIIKWYKYHKKIKILWKIAEYYTKRKYSPENVLNYLYWKKN